MQSDRISLENDMLLKAFRKIVCKTTSCADNTIPSPMSITFENVTFLEEH